MTRVSIYNYEIINRTDEQIIHDAVLDKGRDSV